MGVSRICCVALTDLNVGTPEDNLDEIKIAKAWSKRRDSLTLHLPSDNIGSGSMSRSTSATTISMKDSGESLENHHNVDELIEKLHHESNIFLQADYLNYFYSTQ